MSAPSGGRSPEVEPFLRGCAWRAAPGIPYPRFDPRDATRIPADTWQCAQIPAGVRLEFVGDASAVELDYTTTTDDLGYRGEGAGTTFALWRADTPVDEQTAVLGSGTVTLALDGDADDVAIVYLPEGMRPEVLASARRGRLDRARAGRPALGRLRRLVARGVGGECARAGVGGGRGASPWPRSRESRLRRLGARRDPLCRSRVRAGGRRDLDHPRDQLLDAYPAQCGHDARDDAGVPRHRAGRSSRDPDGGGEPGVAS